MIIKFNELDSIRKNNENKKIGICKGSFDIFHYSHLMLFKYIKNECDILVVILKNDDDVRKKGINRPIFNEKERLEMIDNIKFVDYAILQKDKEETKLINTLIYKVYIYDNGIACNKPWRMFIRQKRTAQTDTGEPGRDGRDGVRIREWA